MSHETPFPVAQLFPNHFTAGELYHCGEDFYLVRNPRFTEACSKSAQTNVIAYIIVIKGYIDGSIDGRQVHIPSGSSAVTLNKQYVSISGFSEDLECGLYFFSQKVANSFFVRPSYAIFREVQERPIIALNDFSLKALTQIFDLLITTLSHPNADEMLDTCISLLNISFRLAAPPALLEPESPVLNTREEKLTRQFLNLLERNYRVHREVSYYADLLCVTPKYLSTCIKEASGYPANQWINRYVIRDAQQLLTTTNMPIKGIASLLHFDDQLLFGKYFRRQTGVSPSLYRSQNH